MVDLSNKDVSKVEDGVNELLAPLGYILMRDPKDKTKFYIQVISRKGRESDVQAILEWIGSLIANPGQCLKNTFWNGEEVVK